MKTIIKLLIAAAIVNGTARVGMVAAKYYEFRDESQQFVTFGANAPPGDLQRQIMDKATALQVPVAFDDIQVQRDGLKTIATASYTEPVEVFPNYKYPIKFHFSVEGVNLGQGANERGINPLRN